MWREHISAVIGDRAGQAAPRLEVVQEVELQVTKLAANRDGVAETLFSVRLGRRECAEITALAKRPEAPSGTCATVTGKVADTALLVFEPPVEENGVKGRA